MERNSFHPKISIFPIPVVVISIGKDEEHNIITLAYLDKVCFRSPIININLT